MSILIKPVISEKANDAGELMSQYSFYVDTKANKLQIKEAVEKAYGVTVTKVRTMVYSPKYISRYTKAGLQTGKTKKMKKAIVHLEEGQEIDIFGQAV